MPKTFMELIETYKASTGLCDAEEAARRIKGEQDLVLVDVRESAEFDAQPVPGAINIPRGFIEFKIAEACSAGDRPILLHCRTGGRAVLAARTLAEMGYEEVTVYQGSVDDLLAALE